MLVCLNIINLFLSVEENSMNTFVISEKIVNLLLDGKYMDIILKISKIHIINIIKLKWIARQK